MAHGLTFGLVPHIDDRATKGALDRLCERLSEETAIAVRGRLVGAPMALAEAVAAGDVDIAWLSPTLLLEAPLTGAIPLLSSVRQGVAAYHAVLFVPSSSRFETVEDLAGARVAWVARTSAAGYIIPRVSLIRRGIDVRSHFAEELFLSSHGAVAWAVHEGRADAGATYAVFERADPTARMIKSGYTDFLPELDARSIDVTGPIPSDLVVARSTVGMRERAMLAGALSRMAADPTDCGPIRYLIGAEAFRPFSHETLLALTDLLEDARRLGAVASGS